MADAVLYEGYLLYPYRKSSGKNRVRWQFGVLGPRQWIEPREGPAPTVAGSAESWFQQAECLVEPSAGATVHVRARFLQLQARQVEAVDPERGFVGVERLEAGGVTHETFEEAVEREFDAAVGVDEILGGERTFRFETEAGEDVEALVDLDGVTVGRIRRRGWTLSATMRISAERPESPFPLLRLRVRTENAVEGVDPGEPREAALRRSLLASHTILVLDGGTFLSLLDPPQWAAAAAAACRNVHVFPVLVGGAPRRDAMLASPIILYDHPGVAPESPGPLFDATEIDEILSLRTLTLTEDEQRQVRATDPRGAALLDRVDTLPPEVLARLHGAVRSVRPVGAGSDGAATDAGGGAGPPWWSPEADASVSPDTDSVDVDGVPVAKGDRVRLRPTGVGADAHDMFLSGRTARVEAVFLDVDARHHLAVTLEDDPSAELQQWYGRFLYFAPEEVERLLEAPEARP